MSNKKKRKNTSPLNQKTTKKVNTEMDQYIKIIVDQNAQVIQENKLLYSKIEQHIDLCGKRFESIEENASKIFKRVNNLERVSTLKAVNIFGVPVYESETTADLVKIIKKIGNVLKASLSEKDIDDVFRFGRDKKAIRVELVTKLKKRELIAAIKQREIKGKDIGLDFNEQIFMSEHLPYENHKLYIDAKKLKKEKALAFVWINQGRVLVRQKEGVPAIVVNSCVDLMQFCHK